MPGGTLLFLGARAIHVLMAAMWIGAAAFMVFMLSPVVEQSGPAGGAIMGGLGRRGFHAYMASVSGATVLTGIYLYWRFTGGFDPAVSRSTAGLCFGIGGALGIVAMILGGSVVGRGGKRLLAMRPKLAAMPDGPDKAALGDDIRATAARVGSATKLVTALAVAALVLMTLGHYL